MYSNWFLSDFLHISLYSSKQQEPIVSLSCPSLNIISSASLTTSTSLAMYSFSLSVISHPAYRKPVYSMSSFLPKLSPILLTLNGKSFSESLISIKWLFTFIIMVYHIPLSDILYLKELFSINFSCNHSTSFIASPVFLYACLNPLSIIKYDNQNEPSNFKL